MAGGDHNVKYPDLVHWYRSYEGAKCSYWVFYGRVVRYWYPKEKAISPITLLRDNNKTEVRENGRICTVCGVFKLRDEFARTKATTTGRTSNCKACRNEMKKSYREKNWYAKDKEYKQKTRKLEIWNYIAFLNPVYIDWAPRENVREVVGYQFKKGYQLKSVHTGACRTLDTNDNRKVSQNCLPYYRVDAPIQLVDNSKPTLLAQKNVYELY